MERSRVPFDDGGRDVGVPATRRLAAAMRHPERWLAVLRIVVGAWFLKSLFTVSVVPADAYDALILVADATPVTQL